MACRACGADTAHMENDIVERTRVFLAEDSDDIRTRLSDMLCKVPGVAIVGEARIPAIAIEGILRTRPHFVVLDIQLASGSGIEVLRTICPMKTGIVFIMLTNHSAPQYRNACMRAGASYFLDKTTEFEKVKEVIQDLCHTRPAAEKSGPSFNSWRKP
jgi:two-component system response regulator DevR